MFIESKVKTTFYKHGNIVGNPQKLELHVKYKKPREHTPQKVSFECYHHKISSEDLKVRTYSWRKMVKYSSFKGVVISECPIQLIQSLNATFRNVVFTLN